MGNLGIDMAKVCDLTRRLNILLNDSQPGLSTWHTAVQRIMRELRDELNRVLVLGTSKSELTR